MKIEVFADGSLHCTLNPADAEDVMQSLLCSTPPRKSQQLTAAALVERLRQALGISADLLYSRRVK